MVVLAGIAQDKGKVLIAKRLEHKSNGGLWEFPGGKLEEGESDGVALVREFHEEFHVDISVGDYLGTFHYRTENIYIELRVYYVAIAGGTFALVDHSEIRWEPIANLERFTFSPADIPVVEKLFSKIDTE